MIDIFNEVYTKIADALRAEFADPNFNINSRASPVVSDFPAAQILERSNTMYTRTQDSGSNENHADIMLQCEYYDNSKSTRQATCKRMAAIVDGILGFYNFNRIMLMPVDNMDSRIYRMTAQYTAVVGKDGVVYRR